MLFMFWIFEHSITFYELTCEIQLTILIYVARYSPQEVTRISELNLGVLDNTYELPRVS